MAKCSECNTSQATKKFYDQVGVYPVCSPCFDKLDYQLWSDGVDSAFGSKVEYQKSFKSFLIKFVVLLVIFLITWVVLE